MTTLLFGDDLQTRLNNIRASNRISRATVAERSDQTKYSAQNWSNKQQKGKVITLPEQEEYTAEEQPDEPITNLSQLQVRELKTLVPDIIHYFEKRATCFQAGQLVNSLGEWEKCTSDSEVLRTVCGEYIEFVFPPVQVRPCMGTRFTDSDNVIIAQELDKLLTKGVIVKSIHEEGEYISPIFL